MSETKQSKSDTSLDRELDAQTIQKMSRQLQSILAMRGDLNLKVAMRVTFLTRFVMTMLGMITLSLLLLMIIMSNRIVVLTDTVNTMNTVFTNMTDDMVIMREHVGKMETNVASMPNMYQNLISMDKTMIDMNGDIKYMATDMQTIRADMDKMVEAINKMDGEFSQTHDSLIRMQSDVDILSSPMRMFNKMLGI